METAPAGPEPLRALEEGRGFVALTSWRKVRVAGADARTWLHDLLTADVASLRPGLARRALFLAPTGRIRADLHVVAEPPGMLLLQDDAQPRGIDDLLAPYLLSSAVTLEDVAGSVAVLAVPGPGRPPIEIDGERVARVGPSALGPGVDLITDPRDEPALRDRLAAAGFVEAAGAEVETWRIRGGRPRMGVDFDADALPSEVGLEETIDDKGCFPGQEAVAKIRNLGHAPWLLVPAHADSRPRPGETIVGDHGSAGMVTSAALDAAGGWSALIRVRWADRGSRLRTASGTDLLVVPRPS